MGMIKKMEEGNYASSKNLSKDSTTRCDLGLTLLPGSQISDSFDERSKSAALARGREACSRGNIRQGWRSQTPTKEINVVSDSSSPLSACSRPGRRGRYNKLSSHHAQKSRSQSRAAKSGSSYFKWKSEAQLNSKARVKSYCCHQPGAGPTLIDSKLEKVEDGYEDVGSDDTNEESDIRHSHRAQKRRKFELPIPTKINIDSSIKNSQPQAALGKDYTKQNPSCTRIVTPNIVNDGIRDSPQKPKMIVIPIGNSNRHQNRLRYLTVNDDCNTDEGDSTTTKARLSRRHATSKTYHSSTSGSDLDRARSFNQQTDCQHKRGTASDNRGSTSTIGSKANYSGLGKQRLSKLNHGELEKQFFKRTNLPTAEATYSELGKSVVRYKTLSLPVPDFAPTPQQNSLYNTVPPFSLAQPILASYPSSQRQNVVNNLSSFASKLSPYLTKSFPLIHNIFAPQRQRRVSHEFTETLASLSKKLLGSSAYRKRSASLPNFSTTTVISVMQSQNAFCSWSVPTPEPSPVSNYSDPMTGSTYLVRGPTNDNFHSPAYLPQYHISSINTSFNNSLNNGVTYQPTYSPAHQQNNGVSYQPTCSPAHQQNDGVSYQPTYSPAHQQNNGVSYQPACSPAHQQNNGVSYQPACSPAHQQNDGVSYQPACSPAHQQNDGVSYQPACSPAHQQNNGVSYQPTYSPAYQQNSYVSNDDNYRAIMTQLAQTQGSLGHTQQLYQDLLRKHNDLEVAIQNERAILNAQINNLNVQYSSLFSEKKQREEDLSSAYAQAQSFQLMSRNWEAEAQMWMKRASDSEATNQRLNALLQQGAPKLTSATQIVENITGIPPSEQSNATKGPLLSCVAPIDLTLDEDMGATSSSQGQIEGPVAEHITPLKRKSSYSWMGEHDPFRTVKNPRLEEAGGASNPIYNPAPFGSLMTYTSNNSAVETKSRSKAKKPQGKKPTPTPKRCSRKKKISQEAEEVVREEGSEQSQQEAEKQIQQEAEKQSQQEAEKQSQQEAEKKSQQEAEKQSQVEPLDQSLAATTEPSPAKKTPAELKAERAADLAEKQRICREARKRKEEADEREKAEREARWAREKAEKEAEKRAWEKPIQNLEEDEILGKQISDELDYDLFGGDELDLELFGDNDEEQPSTVDASTEGN